MSREEPVGTIKILVNIIGIVQAQINCCEWLSCPKLNCESCNGNPIYVLLDMQGVLGENLLFAQP